MDAPKKTPHWGASLMTQITVYAACMTIMYALFNLLPLGYWTSVLAGDLTTALHHLLQ
jgi:uncharacterized protein YqfA (UPF0365 family)